MSIETLVDEAFASLSAECIPHVASKIEPGAILYSSWGYDQTNIDFYMVTRTTAKSAWIVPMSSPIVEQTGFMSENVVAGEPLTNSGWCECDHRLFSHSDYGCNFSDLHNNRCECQEARPMPIKPEMHRIKNYRDGGCLSLTSYSGAYLWEGNKLYASHYA